MPKIVLHAICIAVIGVAGLTQVANARDTDGSCNNICAEDCSVHSQGFCTDQGSKCKATGDCTSGGCGGMGTQVICKLSTD